MCQRSTCTGGGGNCSAKAHHGLLQCICCRAHLFMTLHSCRGATSVSRHNHRCPACSTTKHGGHDLPLMSTPQNSTSRARKPRDIRVGLAGIRKCTDYAVCTVPSRRTVQWGMTFCTLVEFHFSTFWYSTEKCSTCFLQVWLNEPKKCCKRQLSCPKLQTECSKLQSVVEESSVIAKCVLVWEI